MILHFVIFTDFFYFFCSESNSSGLFKRRNDEDFVSYLKVHVENLIENVFSIVFNHPSQFRLKLNSGFRTESGKPGKSGKSGKCKLLEKFFGKSGKIWKNISDFAQKNIGKRIIDSCLNSVS